MDRKALCRAVVEGHLAANTLRSNRGSDLLPLVELHGLTWSIDILGVGLSLVVTPCLPPAPVAVEQPAGAPETPPPVSVVPPAVKAAPATGQAPTGGRALDNVKRETVHVTDGHTSADLRMLCQQKVKNGTPQKDVEAALTKRIDAMTVAEVQDAWERVKAL